MTKRRFTEKFQQAILAIQNKEDIAYNVASERGQRFDNVKHMRWFVRAVAEALRSKQTKKENMKNKLDWQTLDKCKTAEEIATLLRAHGINGAPGNPDRCPLAKATGYSVHQTYAERREGGGWRPHTWAEYKFVESLDDMSDPRFDDLRYDE